jgi:hypothetical protein
MEDITPYIVKPKKLEQTSTQTVHVYRYENGITIKFVDKKFDRAEFAAQSPYTREQWRMMASIEAEITRLEAQL